MVLKFHGTRTHITITYRSFGILMKIRLSRICLKLLWEVVAAFDDMNYMVQTWNYLFLEIINNMLRSEITELKGNTNLNG